MFQKNLWVIRIYQMKYGIMKRTQNIQFVMIKWMRMIPVPILVLLQNVLALRIIYIILMLQWEIFEFNSI